MRYLNDFKNNWNAVGGYLEFLKIALPLIIATGAWAFQNFVNRFFLAWHSQDAFAASLPAGMLAFSIMSVFIGTVSYVDVFISQYYGKKEYRSIGPSVWQSVYLSFAGAAVLILISFFSEEIFNFIGHDKEIAAQEIKYFRFLCLGAFTAIMTPALSGFYAGRGKTKVILQINVVGIILNVVLDYLLIFGSLGFPAWGIEGAAAASIISSAIMDVIFIFLIISQKNDETYNTKTIKPDFGFMKKLFRFGFPNGVQFFFDMSTFTFFILVMGTIGKLELSATNMALNINHLTFMPLTGFGIATSILVGHYLGKNRPDIAQICVKTAFKSVYVYISALVIALLVIPNAFIYPFSKGAESLIIEQIRPTTINILRFVALYSLFDPANIIFSSAIKGAGDTAFVMKFLVSASVLIWAVPVYLTVVTFHLGLYIGWGITVFYAIFLALIFYLRYKTGKWKRMRVIEMEIVDI
ncbi:MAG: MATE family efflux transporter [Endomicrobium sp.]|jgi:MATE family multidrug resistance protein|nr:MATE family efflux transporter [Endomicrobium sp.]